MGEVLLQPIGILEEVHQLLMLKSADYAKALEDNDETVCHKTEVLQNHICSTATQLSNDTIKLIVKPGETKKLVIFDLTCWAFRPSSVLEPLHEVYLGTKNLQDIDGYRNGHPYFETTIHRFSENDGDVFSLMETEMENSDEYIYDEINKYGRKDLRMLFDGFTGGCVKASDLVVVNDIGVINLTLPGSLFPRRTTGNIPVSITDFYTWVQVFEKK